MLALAGCSGEGIDRNPEAAIDGSSAQGNVSGNIGTPGPSRYVVLNKLNFEATLPSIISVLFQANNQYGSQKAS